MVPFKTCETRKMQKRFMVTWNHRKPRMMKKMMKMEKDFVNLQWMNSLSHVSKYCQIYNLWLCIFGDVRVQLISSTREDDGKWGKLFEEGLKSAKRDQCQGGKQLSGNLSEQLHLDIQYLSVSTYCVFNFGRIDHAFVTLIFAFFSITLSWCLTES